MKNRLDNLLKAINLADMDAVKTVEISVDDLLFLRSVINDQSKTIARINRELHIEQAKVSLNALDKPIKLDIYI